MFYNQTNKTENVILFQKFVKMKRKIKLKNTKRKSYYIFTILLSKMTYRLLYFSNLSFI